MKPVLIEHLILHLSMRQVKPTTTDAFQFELNTKAEHTNNFLEKIHETAIGQFDLIGKEVFKFEKTIKFITIENWNESYNPHFNPIEKTPLIMSEQNYLDYEKNHIDFLIDRLKNGLLNDKLFIESTNQLRNLQRLWIFEENQNLLKIFESIKQKIN